MFCWGSAQPNVGGEFTHGQPSSRKHCPSTLPKNGEGEKAAFNKLNTGLAKELKPLLDENKEVSSWTVDIHTCQLRQQEAKVERMRGKLYLNVD
jgi:hypothetical protein